MTRFYLLFSILFACGFGSVSRAQDAGSEKPNILFIAMDDLNDWIGCFGGNPQSITPNLDRMAASGVLFTNAHCPAAACNPSRTAIMTGMSPHRSGLYSNEQKMREILPEVDILPQHFRNHGYRSSGSGKMLHYFTDARSWDEYFPAKEKENPIPPTFYPENRPVNLPVGGPWQYVETDWAALDVTDEEFGGDWSVSEWVSKKLGEKHEKPQFLACGIYRPHEPWFVPAKYFEPFPLEDIQLPRGYKSDDLDDLPPAGKKRGPNRYFAHIQKNKQWKKGIQGYLASIHFADAMLGRVLDALENGPNKDNTIVVLWSDHGWHLGEKEHWQKFTGWRAVTRVPLMIKVPKNLASSLPAGTKAGGVCDQPVSVLSLFPTLTDLAGISSGKGVDGTSLTPLLKNPEAEWDGVAVTFLHDGGSYGLSAKDWRYIHYADGGEELYHIAKDPYEWDNLAGSAEYAKKLEELRELGPKEFARKKAPSIKALSALKWRAITGEDAPASKPDGASFKVAFINRRSQPVELFWMDGKGGAKSYGLIESGKTQEQSTRPGAVWRIGNPGEKNASGYFVVGDRRSKAVIPKLPKNN